MMDEVIMDIVSSLLLALGNGRGKCTKYYAFARNSEGVSPVIFLNAVLNDDFDM
jgi:hypothetical protein